MSAKGSSSGDDRDEALRQSLLKLREKVIKDTESELSRYIKGEDRESVENVLDTGDWSVFELTDALKLNALESHRQTLIMLDESIRKLDEGSYGVCDDCGEAINEGRIKVLPFAIRCRDCQEEAEEKEAAGRASGNVTL
ncbi:MAG TPA: TraR/DksA family transcriptional regulator [Nitrospirae bacterium]|nr:TraR/DksA family transcriptional regulator [Nitrospirota bacterium]